MTNAEAADWISVKDRLPESGKHVLAACEIKFLNGSKEKYICEAYHAKEHSILAGKYLDDTDCYDYNEEDDEYYLKEGWYEVIHNWDEYESVVIGDFVTHWMPLPEPPEESKRQMNNWRNDKVTEKQLEYILEMREHSEYSLPEFTGTTKGEAADYINRWTKLAHESRWAIEHGY